VVTSPSSKVEVLIVGAGPTGLVLALWLTRLGLRVRIVDKTEEPGTTSRALAVQARTLEMYGQIGLADAVVGAGRTFAAVNLWVAGKKSARIVFADLGVGVSPFPYALIYPQDEHEKLLIDRLAQRGVEVERRTELLGFEEFSDGVRTRLRGPDGAITRCEATYVAGCDGTHSTVRESLRIGFPGGTYEHLFYVADVEGGGTATNGDVHVGLDRADFLAVFPLKGEGRVRLVGTIRPGAEQTDETLSWDDVSQRVIEWMRIDVRRVNWFSTYHVHHRVADHFRQGRAFLLGDAAHIHSPVGGQGMNTGIGDAINLAWKLASVLQGTSDGSLLDSYEPERIAFARRLVATTDQAFTGVTSSGMIARRIRLDVAPAILPVLFRFQAIRRFLFRTVSQTNVNYRKSDFNEGRAGPIHGGDRLPWAETDSESGWSDNYAPLTSLDWQLHVYGEITREIRAVCERRNLAVHVFPWQRQLGSKGLRRGALYLVRPDGYVGFVDAGRRAAALTSYLDARRITFRSRPADVAVPSRSRVPLASSP
jgi:2-polyprenyl-6-methoxyphenol hydroxylase-like FAD-dependent oxidoreductase